MSSAVPMQHAHSEATQPAHARVEQASAYDAPPVFVDQRSQAISQRRLQDIVNNSSQTRQLKLTDQLAQNSIRSTQLRTMSAMTDVPVLQKMEDEEAIQAQTQDLMAQRREVETTSPQPNNTGLPDNLKSGIESLSGMSMDHVKVHYNSAQPAQLNAHAYAQGSEIHVAPGQEQHLPHEAWHVVQQAQGRVKPTMQMKAGAPVNDDAGLETEADVMGARAVQMQAPLPGELMQKQNINGLVSIQRALVTDQEILDKRTNNFNWVSFRGTRDDSDPNNKAVEKGRGANLSGGTFGGGVKSEISWNGVESKSGEGLNMEAIIGPDHNLGSSPTVPNAKARVDAFEMLSGKEYASGHLLNEKLGGPGDDPRNLTAISKSANTLQSSNIEKYVRDPVNDEGYWYKYVVKITYSSDDKEFSTSDKKYMAYNAMLKKPQGIVEVTSGSNKKKLTVTYANKLDASWHQLDTKGRKLGDVVSRSITLESPLEGGKAEINSKAKPKSIITGGKVAKTDIGPEELVLTTGTLLLSVVKNREGLIGLLKDLREDKENLAETVKQLELLYEQSEQGNFELEKELAELQLDYEEGAQILYDSGYDFGYDNGYAAAYDDAEYDYYDDPVNYGDYSKGYADGYEAGHQFALGEIRGYEHGYADKVNYRMDDGSDFESGYQSGHSKGRYDLNYEKGEDDGYFAGYNDNSFYYESGADGYAEGYDRGYDEGFNQGPFVAGKMLEFDNVTMADKSGKEWDFFGAKTVIKMTGYQPIYDNQKWYQVVSVASEHRDLIGYHDFMYMKKISVLNAKGVKKW